MKQWFINQSTLHPLRSIIVMLVVTLIVGSGVRFIIIDDDFLNMLPDDMPTVQAWENIQDEFGSTNAIFIVFGHPGTEAVTVENLKVLWDLTIDLENHADVDEVISIASMNRIDSEDGFMEVNDLQPYRDLEQDEVATIREYLDDNPSMKVRVVSRHEDYLSMMVRGHVDGSQHALAQAVLATCDEALADYTVHYGGDAYLTGTIPSLIQEEIRVLLALGLLVMALILLASFRNLPALGIELLTIILSLVFMMGSLGWMLHFTGSDKFLFTVLNASMPLILLTIANSYGVHIITKFMRQLRKGSDAVTAVANTLDSLLTPIFLTSLTTIIAFLSMVLAPLEPLMGYGIAISLGVTWAWLLTSIFMPAFLRLKRWNLESRSITHDSHIEKLISRYSRFLTGHPKKVLTGALILVAITVYGTFELKIEANLASFFKPGTEIRESIDFLDEEMNGMLDMQMRIEGDMRSPEVLQRMDDIQNFLENNFHAVSTTLSLADIIKTMHRTVMDDSLEYEVIPEDRAKINNLLTLYSMSGDPDDFSNFVDYDYETGLLTAFMRTIPTSEIVTVVDSIDAFLAVDQPDDMQIGITGMLIIIKDFVHLITRSSAISISVSIILIGIVAGLWFRGLKWGILAVLPLASAVIINFGLMGLTGVALNHVTALLTAIIIGVGVDFAIHYISQFKRNVAAGIQAEEITARTVNEVGFPILLDAASNMAFGTLLVSSLLPLKHMGGLMLVAMVATSFGTLTLLAAIMELSKRHLTNS